jgi:hypothetical protein
MLPSLDDSVSRFQVIRSSWGFWDKFAVMLEARKWQPRGGLPAVAAVGAV